MTFANHHDTFGQTRSASFGRCGKDVPKGVAAGVDEFLKRVQDSRPARAGVTRGRRADPWRSVSQQRSVMQVVDDWKTALGILSVAMAVVAAIIYVIQKPSRGEIRPHPFRGSFSDPERHWLLGSARPGRSAGQLDAPGDDDHLLSVRRGERHAGGAKLFKAGMGVRGRWRGGLHPLSVHQGGQCRGRADDNRRCSRVWLAEAFVPGLGLSGKGQRSPVLRSTARSSSPRSWRWTRYHSPRPFTPRHYSS